MRGFLLWALAGVSGVWGQTPTLAVAPGSLQFTMTAGEVAPASQQVMVTTTPGPVLYNAMVSYGASAGPWLEVTPIAGLSNASLTVRVVNVGNFGAGVYSAMIMVGPIQSASFAAVTVTLTIGPGIGAVGPLTAFPTSLTFQTTSANSPPVAQTLTVVASAQTAMTATVSTNSGGSWLSASPSGSQGTANAFSVAVNPAGLAAGTYLGTVMLIGGGSSVSVPVTLVLDPGTSIIDPMSVSLIGTAGQTAPSTQVVFLQPGVLTNFTVSNIATATGGNWLSVTPSSGVINLVTGFTVGANARGLQAGTYQGSFTVTMAGIAAFSIPVTFVVNAPPTVSTGLRFVPVEPCRMMETRAEYNFAGRTGAFGPPFLSDGETRRMRPQDSTVCSIPAAAKAYSMNVTLVPRGADTVGVRVYPVGENNSEFVSTIAFTSAQTVANTIVAKAGEGGEIAVLAYGAEDVLLDVNGYFVEENRAEALVYYPVAPCRVVETRAAYRLPAGPFGPPALGAGERRTFAFRQSPLCQIPTSARAYSVSLTAVPDGPLAFLSLVPTGGPAPLVSSLNSFGGRVVSNHVIVPAGTNGSIDALSYGKTDVIMDITGYFAPDDGTGLLYYPVTQCRTHVSYFGFEETKRLPAPSERCSWTGPEAKAYLLNVTANPEDRPLPFLTAYPAGQARPGTSFLNAFEGQPQTNSVIVAAGTNGAVDLFAYRPTQVRVEVLGYFGR